MSAFAFRARWEALRGLARAAAGPRDGNGSNGDDNGGGGEDDRLRRRIAVAAADDLSAAQRPAAWSQLPLAQS